ncbi:MAG TPA: flagellar hook-basal body complex protein FliE [Rhodospirillales bacterium]|jgi:flagellar hook-basal body complex protein FliE|nr:flagellar hook-basal body complex protein FliE [Rhodospirillales bacterium]
MADPFSNITSAVNAYNTAARRDISEIDSQDAKTGEEFADLVKGAIKEAVKIGERGEGLSIANISGKTDLTQVVTAVAEAKLTLQTVVTVRDKILESYRQIIRMPV